MIKDSYKSKVIQPAMVSHPQVSIDTILAAAAHVGG
jgi:hypothetical protein